MEKHKRLKSGWVGDTISYLYLSVLSVMAVFPLLWIVLCSVKKQGELLSNPTKLIPSAVTLDNFKNVLINLGFLNNIGNSIIIAFSSTLITITISALGAYGIVRFYPRFGKLMTRVLITTYMFPPILLAVPYSIIMGKAGLMNTRIGLVIVYLSFSVPYAIWLLVGFFKRFR